MKYTYKLQGDGRDSWRVEEPDGNVYMVYEDPTKEQLSLTDDQVLQLFEKFKELGLIN